MMGAAIASGVLGVPLAVLAWRWCLQRRHIARCERELLHCARRIGALEHDLRAARLSRAGRVPGRPLWIN